MIAARYALFIFTATSLLMLANTPNGNPASVWLAGFVFTGFVGVCWTCRGTNARRCNDA